MRTRARIEHSATPITMTTTEIGLRRAQRRSHMTILLLATRRAAIAKMAQGRPGPPRPKRDSARPRGARVRRRSPLAPENSARLKHRPELRGPLDTVRVPESPSCGLHRVREACSLLLFARHQVKLGLCVVALSGLARPDRSALAPRVRSPLPQ